MLDAIPIVSSRLFSNLCHRRRSRRQIVRRVGAQIECLEWRVYLSSLDGIAPAATVDRTIPAFIAFDSVSLSEMSGGLVGGRQRVVALPNGQWIAAGQRHGASNLNGASDLDVGLARFLPSGAIDSSFGVRGMVLMSVGTGDELVKDLAAQPDGKVFVLVNDYPLSFAVPNLNWPYIYGGLGTPRLLRFNADGTLDASFGTAGFADGPSSSGPIMYSAGSMELQSDGRILVGMYRYDFERSVLITRFLMRFHADGTRDKGFGVDGELSTESTTFVVDAKDRIVILGREAGHITVSRFDRDGRPDVSFGHEGTVAFLPGSDEFLLGRRTTLRAQPDGGIVVAAELDPNVDPFFLLSTMRPFAPAGALLVARLTNQGQLDSTFGKDGIVLQPMQNAAFNPGWIELQPEGGVLVGVEVYYTSAQLGRRAEPTETMVLLDKKGQPVPQFGTNGVFTRENSRLSFVPPQLIRGGRHQPPVIAPQSERDAFPPQSIDRQPSLGTLPSLLATNSSFVISSTTWAQDSHESHLAEHDNPAGLSDHTDSSPVLADDIDAFWKLIGRQLIDGEGGEDSPEMSQLIAGIDALA